MIAFDICLSKKANVLFFCPFSWFVFFTVYFRCLFSNSYLAVLFSYPLNTLKGNKPIYITEIKVKFNIADRYPCGSFLLQPTSLGITTNCCMTLLPRTGPDCSLEALDRKRIICGGELCKVLLWDSCLALVFLEVLTQSFFTESEKCVTGPVGCLKPFHLTAMKSTWAVRCHLAQMRQIKIWSVRVSVLPSAARNRKQLPQRSRPSLHPLGD